MMNCNDCRALLGEYLDGTLAPSDRDAVAAHLETCADCRRELAELKTARAALQSWPSVAAPVDFRSRVRSAVEKEPQRKEAFDFLAAFDFLRPRKMVWSGALTFSALLLFFVVKPFTSQQMEVAVPTPKPAEIQGLPNPIPEKHGDNAASKKLVKSEMAAPTPATVHSRGPVRTSEPQKPAARAPQLPAPKFRRNSPALSEPVTPRIQARERPTVQPVPTAHVTTNSASIPSLSTAPPPAAPPKVEQVFPSIRAMRQAPALPVTPLNPPPFLGSAPAPNAPMSEKSAPIAPPTVADQTTVLPTFRGASPAPEAGNAQDNVAAFGSNGRLGAAASSLPGVKSSPESSSLFVAPAAGLPAPKMISPPAMARGGAVSPAGLGAPDARVDSMQSLPAGAQRWRADAVVPKQLAPAQASKFTVSIVPDKDWDGAQIRLRLNGTMRFDGQGNPLSRVVWTGALKAGETVKLSLILLGANAGEKISARLEQKGSDAESKPFDTQTLVLFEPQK